MLNVLQGQVEEALKVIHFERLSIFRPGWVINLEKKRNEYEGHYSNM